MTELELSNRLLPNEYSYDNSRHRYNGKTGFAWEAVNSQGKHFSGIETTQVKAINKAQSLSK